MKRCLGIALLLGACAGPARVIRHEPTGTSSVSPPAPHRKVALDPAGDADGDGIPNGVDKCPNQPKDMDGLDDGDGCPDPDSDGDGIPDIFDACPNEAEDLDGVKDDDGCPDGGRDNLMGPLRILEHIYFEQRETEPLPISAPLLDAIAVTIVRNPQLRVVAVDGHAVEGEPDGAPR